MTAEIIAAAVLFLAVLGLLWAWLRARADARELLKLLSRAAHSLTNANIALDNSIKKYTYGPDSEIKPRSPFNEELTRIMTDADINAKSSWRSVEEHS